MAIIRSLPPATLSTLEGPGEAAKRRYVFNRARSLRHSPAITGRRSTGFNLDGGDQDLGGSGPLLVDVPGRNALPSRGCNGQRWLCLSA